MLGDCRDRLKELPDNSIDSIVTDPPYELGFMGKSWDASGVAYDVTVWQECLRVLKPGGHLLSFGGSRTYHRMACAIEDAGFQIRDQIMWMYGSGFPKSLNISKAIDKAAGAERERVPYKGGIAGGSGNYGGGGQIHVGTKDGAFPVTAEAEVWDGWGTALKPAHEPIVLARKPLDGTVANNVLTHGTGGINIDGCRVKATDSFGGGTKGTSGFAAGYEHDGWVAGSPLGRFPANFIHDGSDEVLELFPDSKGGAYPAKRGQAVNTAFASGQETEGGFRAMGDNGSAARFFYCAKASKKDRNEGLDDFPLVKGGSLSGGEETRPDRPTNHPIRANHHPTVKPTELMRYLCRLITPPDGTVLDPFTGSGSTGKAAVLEGFHFIGVEQSAEYIEIAKARIGAAE
jgi:site-specific DNA-methyltransferase (adenine-specific)